MKAVKRTRTKWPTNNGNGTKPTPANTIYDPDTHPIKAYQLTSMFGCTQQQLADLFGVSVQCVEKWTREHQEFKDFIQQGRDEYYTGSTERSLARRANGYEYHEKTYEWRTNKDTGEREWVCVRLIKKHMPPDPTSMIFYLKCRSPKRWSEPTQQHRHQVEQINVNLHATLADMIQQNQHLDLRCLRDAIATLPKPTNGDASHDSGK